MQIILSDYNCEGQVEAIFNILRYDSDWLTLIPMELRWFRAIGLSVKADDEEIWRVCQEQGYLLLTGNRRAKTGRQTVETTIGHLPQSDALPIITIDNLNRVEADLSYRRHCAIRLAEIVDALERFRGIIRLFIP